MLMDAGNSRLKWTIENLNCQLNDVTATLYNNIEKHQVINGLLSDIKPTKLLIVHVLGIKFESAVRQHCLQLNIEYEVVTTSADCCGVKNAYEILEDLGADRFVALIAAHHSFPAQSVIVIDAGTAVTIDAIDSTGQHLGGLIMPGLQLWSDTLIKNTQLQHIPVKQRSDVFATSTKKGIDNGSLIGLAGAILHTCQSMEQKLKQPVKRILCGGDSHQLDNYFNCIFNSIDAIVVPSALVNECSSAKSATAKNVPAQKDAPAKKKALAKKNASFILMPDLVIHGLTILGGIRG